jgi:hypothetical protein
MIARVSRQTTTIRTAPESSCGHLRRGLPGRLTTFGQRGDHGGGNQPPAVSLLCHPDTLQSRPAKSRRTSGRSMGSAHTNSLGVHSVGSVPVSPFSPSPSYHHRRICQGPASSHLPRPMDGPVSVCAAGPSNATGSDGHPTEAYDRQGGAFPPTSRPFCRFRPAAPDAGRIVPPTGQVSLHLPPAAVCLQPAIVPQGRRRENPQPVVLETR